MKPYGSILSRNLWLADWINKVLNKTLSLSLVWCWSLAGRPHTWSLTTTGLCPWIPSEEIRNSMPVIARLPTIQAHNQHTMADMYPFVISNNILFVICAPGVSALYWLQKSVCIYRSSTSTRQVGRVGGGSAGNDRASSMRRGFQPLWCPLSALVCWLDVMI